MLLRILLVVFCLAGAVAPAFAQEPEPEFAMAELTPETARRAFDAYLIIEAKFAGAAFEEYDSLEDFVLRAPEGRTMVSTSSTGLGGAAKAGAAVAANGAGFAASAARLASGGAGGALTAAASLALLAALRAGALSPRSKSCSSCTALAPVGITP